MWIKGVQNIYFRFCIIMLNNFTSINVKARSFLFWVLELVKIMVVMEDAVPALHILMVRVDYRQMETSLGMGEGYS